MSTGCFARPKAIKFNLDDYVRFRVRPGNQAAFMARPGVHFCEQANPDGTYTGKAQFHTLMAILEGKMVHGFDPPIDMEVEILVDGDRAPYGYCPHCGEPGDSRERRLNGNDRCPNGHVYPSAHARP